MKIVPIYNGYIYSVSYDESEEEDNEFDRLLSLWNDVSYLSDFFNTNAAYLSNETWQKVRLPEMAAHQVIREAEDLENLFEELHDNTEKGRKPDFDSHFKYLGGKYKYMLEYEPMKSYGTESPSLIRLYAVKLGPNTYLITGGGIKLADTIQNSPGLQDHVIKNIDRVRTYLKANGIMNSDDLED